LRAILGTCGCRRKDDEQRGHTEQDCCLMIEQIVAVPVRKHIPKAGDGIPKAAEPIGVKVVRLKFAGVSLQSRESAICVPGLNPIQRIPERK
jgi:hypothetical protein